MNITLCSLPSEALGSRLIRKRSEGQAGIMPKIYIKRQA
tara:strand:- start:238 stop:354 length:117 start_codon:yes stop_codon:yes gene_type:complete